MDLLEAAYVGRAHVGVVEGLLERVNDLSLSIRAGVVHVLDNPDEVREEGRGKVAGPLVGHRHEHGPCGGSGSLFVHLSAGQS